MKEMIEKLKKNEKPFGLMTPEEQECLKKVGKENCVIFNETWATPYQIRQPFENRFTYAIKPDYKPEPEFVDLEIENFDGWLGVKTEDRIPFTHLHCLPSLPKFHSFVYTKVNGVEEWLPAVSVASEIDEGHKVFARFRS